MSTPLDSVLLDRFLADLTGRGFAASTVRLRRERLTQAIEWLRAQGILYAAALSPEDCDRYITHLRERGLRNWTVRSHADGLRSFTRFLTKQDLVLDDPGRDVRVHRTRIEEELPPRPLSREQMAALLAAIEVRETVGYAYRALTELIYATGLRLSEALGLDLADLDAVVGEVRVDGKGGHQRTLPVLHSALLALRDWCAVRRSLVVGPDRGALFIGVGGARITAHTYRAWLRRLGHRALGPAVVVTPHLIRHTCAVHLLMGRADIRLIQELLGHTSLDTTRIYLRLLPDELRSEYEAAMPVLMPTKTA